VATTSPSRTASQTADVTTVTLDPLHPLSVSVRRHGQGGQEEEVTVCLGEEIDRPSTVLASTTDRVTLSLLTRGLRNPPRFVEPSYTWAVDDTTAQAAQWG